MSKQEKHKINDVMIKSELIDFVSTSRTYDLKAGGKITGTNIIVKSSGYKIGNFCPQDQTIFLERLSDETDWEHDRRAGIILDGILIGLRVGKIRKLKTIQNALGV